MDRCRRIGLLLWITLWALPNFAANFAISTLGTLPTKVRSGGAVTAHFLITNNTARAMSGFSVNGLPDGVRQQTSTTRYQNQYTTCASSVSLTAGARCVLALEITQPATFTFSLCKSATCTRSPTSVSVTTQTVIDPNFPYGSAPDGDVCVSQVYYATPETMLGSWAMIDALALDIDNGDFGSSFMNTTNTVYAVGTAAVGDFYGIDNCSGGCDALNGYCFAAKFSTKSSWQYMIFQSVNIGASSNTFDIYMAGGGCGAFCSSCPTFWGTSSINWTNNIENCSSGDCSCYFGDYSDINTSYAVTYANVSYDAKTTLQNACSFASSNKSGFNTENFTNVEIIPVYCPTALTQVTGTALSSSVTTIGTNGQALVHISDITDEDFASAPQITTTQMQDCRTPSSGYCGKESDTVINYQASISANLTEPLLSGTEEFCTKNPSITSYCSWDSCSTDGSSTDYCAASQTQCENDCAGTWCTCS